MDKQDLTVNALTKLFLSVSFTFIMFMKPADQFRKKKNYNLYDNAIFNIFYTARNDSITKYFKTLKSYTIYIFT